jgi:restriction system protein
MTIPTYNELMLPILGVLSTEPELSSQALRERLSQKLKLSEADLRELLPNSPQPKFHNRTHWAVFYMGKAGLVAPVKRGVHKITDRGREVLRQAPAMSSDYLRQFPEFAAWHKRSADVESDVQQVKGRSDVAELPPDERLASAYAILRRHVEDELLRRIMERSPEFFERLVISLLQAMGYGGPEGDAEHTGASGDGGIDGVIREDKLGLEVVYLQAKRYDPERNVPAREVRDFIGALEAARAKRGVLITTAADFAKDSLELVGRIDKRIVLINGRRLVSLMFDHGVGVREKSRFVVKEVDEDTFSEE